MTEQLTATEKQLIDLQRWVYELDKHVNQRLGFIEKTIKDRDGEIEACHRIMAECRQIAGDPNGMTVQTIQNLLMRAEKAEHDLDEMTAVYTSAQRNSDEWQAMCNNLVNRADKAEHDLTDLQARYQELQSQYHHVDIEAQWAKEKAARSPRKKPCIYTVDENYNFTPGCKDDVKYSFLTLPEGPFCTHCGHPAQIPLPKAQP